MPQRFVEVSPVAVGWGARSESGRHSREDGESDEGDILREWSGRPSQARDTGD